MQGYFGYLMIGKAGQFPDLSRKLENTATPAHWKNLLHTIEASILYLSERL